MLLKSGTLFKRSHRSSLFKRQSWTPRYCTLTTKTLYYFDQQDGNLKGTIDLSEADALDIMPLDCQKTGKSISTGWRIAIQTPTERYLIAATTEREMYEWVDALNQIVQENLKRRHWITSLTLKPSFIAV